MAHAREANVPLSSLLHEIFKAAKVSGARNWGQPGIIAYWRKLNEPGQ